MTREEQEKEAAASFFNTRVQQPKKLLLRDSTAAKEKFERSVVQSSTEQAYCSLPFAILLTLLVAANAPNELQLLHLRSFRLVT